MLFPESTVPGVAAVVSTRSACVAAPTTSVAVAAFAPNAWFAALTVAVSLIVVPFPVPAVTLYTTVNVPDAPAATLGFVHCGGKPAQLHPAGATIETNVVFVGVVSLNVAVVAAPVPVFVTTCV